MGLLPLGRGLLGPPSRSAESQGPCLLALHSIGVFHLTAEQMATARKCGRLRSPRSLDRELHKKRDGAVGESIAKNGLCEFPLYLAAYGWIDCDLQPRRLDVQRPREGNLAQRDESSHQFRACCPAFSPNLVSGRVPSHRSFSRH
jgi:hypothetical protein